MGKFLRILTVAVMLLPGQIALAVPAEESAQGEVSSDELALEVLQVNINTDDAETIAAGLNRIGLKRAEAIVRYREDNGPFRNAGELANVKGIGAATVSANADRIVVD